MADVKGTPNINPGLNLGKDGTATEVAREIKKKLLEKQEALDAKKVTVNRQPNKITLLEQNKR